MKLLIFACVVAVAYSAVVDECAYGESYWCSSLQKATKCGAFKHCMDTVWPHQKLEKDGSDVCTFCEDIVKDVRALVDDKKNQQQVKDFLDKACNIIPDEAFAQKCKTAANDQIDEVVQLIDSVLDPATVCSVIGLCKGFEDQVKHAPVEEVNTVLKASPAQPMPKIEPACTDCKKFMGDIKALITDKSTEKEFVELLEQQLCSQLGDLQSMCNTVVEQFAPEIFQMLSQEVEPNMICQAFGFCPSTPAARKMFAKIRLSLSPLAKAKKVGDDTTCLVCKTVIGELREVSRDKNTQAEVQTFVKKNLCAMLGDLQDICDQTVDQYGPELFELLVNELDPEARCLSLGLCSSSSAETIIRNASPKQPPQSKPIQSGQVMAGKATASGEACVLCELVVKQVDSMLADNATEKEIQDALDQVCSMLPSSIADTCKTFVDTYGPVVLNLLANELTPDQVCGALGLCTQNTKKSTMRAPSTQCVLCEFVIKELDQLIGDNATEKEIIQALDQVCGVLPDTIKETCNQFVNQYGPTVIALLLQELDPQQVCTAIKLCSPSTIKTTVREPAPKPVKSVKASAECTLCEFVMNELDTVLKDNATQEEIMESLSEVCQLLPQTIEPDCEDFVHTYGNLVIQILSEELDPSLFCQTIGLCPSKMTLLKKANVKISQPKVRDDEMCGVCETVIQYIDSLLEEKPTAIEIEKVLNKVCNFLPENLRKQCDEFVHDYTAPLIQLLAQFVDPREICTDIALCTNSTQTPNGMVKLVPAKQHLLGDNECTYGPSYWCASMDNAKKCGMVSHCKNHVWE